MRPDLDADGPAAPPRANGEVVFTAPWQRRVFATTMAACEAGLVDYEQFRDRLIEQIAGRDQHGVENYWAAWQDAIETLTMTAGAVSATELDRRATAFAEHH
ncbi:MAG: nitrile hydratase accessory protein [Actinomycetota bacterium]